VTASATQRRFIASSLDARVIAGVRRPPRLAAQSIDVKGDRNSSPICHSGAERSEEPGIYNHGL
jgi:hypothetical protein